MDDTRALVGNRIPITRVSAAVEGATVARIDPSKREGTLSRPRGSMPGQTMSHNRAVIAGGVVTAVSTCVLFVTTVLVPSEWLKLLVFERLGVWWSGNPFAQLRYLGGIPGGLVAGYIARDHWGKDEWGTAMSHGAYAALLGLGLLYTTFVVYNVVRSVLVVEVFPPPLYIITVVPLIYAIPLAPAYVIEALVAALIGNGCSRVIRDSGMERAGER